MADTPETAGGLGADLEQLEANGAAGGLGEPGVGETDPAERAEQDIGQGGEPAAELVGAHGGGRGAVGEQVELAFLDPVSPSCRGRSRSPRRDMGPQLRTA